MILVPPQGLRSAPSPVGSKLDSASTMRADPMLEKAFSNQTCWLINQITNTTSLIGIETHNCHADEIHHNGLSLSPPVEQTSSQLSTVDCLMSLGSEPRELARWLCCLLALSCESLTGHSHMWDIQPLALMNFKWAGHHFWTKLEWGLPTPCLTVCSSSVLDLQPYRFGSHSLYFKRLCLYCCSSCIELTV